MPDFRRYYVPNRLVFITVVTRDRLPYLGQAEDIVLFWKTVRAVQRIHPFRLLAYVVLPDHFHWLMRVDDANGDFSIVLHSIKRNYALNFKKLHDITGSLHLWQTRFWDHVIRDDPDLVRHLDYIHWNPVKHGLVQSPEDWAHSTYSYWLGRGYYEPGWGVVGKPSSIAGMNPE